MLSKGRWGLKGQPLTLPKQIADGRDLDTTRDILYCSCQEERIFGGRPDAHASMGLEASIVQRGQTEAEAGPSLVIQGTLVLKQLVIVAAHLTIFCPSFPFLQATPVSLLIH